MAAILLCLAPVVRAQEAGAPSGPRAGAFNLDLNYPGAAVRYFPAAGRGLELLGQKQDKVSVLGLRYYRYIRSMASGPLWPYLAAEADYLDFKGDYSKGKGWGGGLYAGVEYSLGRRVSVQTDMGAMYVSVEDKATSLGESGLEFLLNFGVNFYFGGGK